MDKLHERLVPLLEATKEGPQLVVGVGCLPTGEYVGASIHHDVKESDQAVNLLCMMMDVGASRFVRSPREAVDMLEECLRILKVSMLAHDGSRWESTSLDEVKMGAVDAPAQ